MGISKLASATSVDVQYEHIIAYTCRRSRWPWIDNLTSNPAPSAAQVGSPQHLRTAPPAAGGQRGAARAAFRSTKTQRWANKVACRSVHHVQGLVGEGPGRIDAPPAVAQQHRQYWRAGNEGALAKLQENGC